MVSQLKVNEIIKQSGSSITIGESGDTVSGPFTNLPAFLERGKVFDPESKSISVVMYWTYHVFQYVPCCGERREVASVGRR